jgi:hypothetical protein
MNADKNLSVRLLCIFAAATISIIHIDGVAASESKVKSIFVNTNAGHCILNAAQFRSVKICIDRTTTNQLPSLALEIENENGIKTVDTVTKLIEEEFFLERTQPDPMSLGFMAEQLIAFENLSTNSNRTNDRVERILQTKSDKSGKLIFLSAAIVFSDGSTGLIRISDVHSNVTLSIVDGQLITDSQKAILKASLGNSELAEDPEIRRALCQLKLLSSVNRVVQKCFPIEINDEEDSDNPLFESKKGAKIRIDRFESLNSFGEYSIIHLNEYQSFRFNAENGELRLLDHKGDQVNATWFKGVGIPFESDDFQRDLGVFKNAERDIRLLALIGALDEWDEHPATKNKASSTSFEGFYLITAYFDDQSFLVFSSVALKSVLFEGNKLELTTNSQQDSHFSFSNVSELRKQVTKERLAQIGYACDKVAPRLEPYPFWKKEMNFILSTVLERKKKSHARERRKTIFNFVQQFSETPLTAGNLATLSEKELKTKVEMQQMQPAGFVSTFNQLGNDQAVIYLDAYDTLLLLDESNIEFTEEIRLEQATKVEELEGAISAILEKRKRNKSIVVMINVDSNMSIARSLAAAFERKRDLKSHFYFASEKDFF